MSRSTKSMLLSEASCLLLAKNAATVNMSRYPHRTHPLENDGEFLVETGWELLRRYDVSARTTSRIYARVSIPKIVFANCDRLVLSE